MGALDVVRKDLQLRLGIDSGSITQKQVPIGLFRVGLLSLGLYEHLAIEHAPGTSVQHTFIDFPAPTIRVVVVYGGMVVHQLLAAGEIKPVQQGLDVLVIQTSMEIVPRNGTAHGH